MAAKPSKKRLTPREQAFISYYLIDPNATQAARLAGYSPKTARQIGYENLTKPHIVAEIKRRRATMLDALQMDADELPARMICSGLLATERARVEKVFGRLGYESKAFREIENWGGLLLEPGS